MQERERFRRDKRNRNKSPPPRQVLPVITQKCLSRLHFFSLLLELFVAAGARELISSTKKGRVGSDIEESGDEDKVGMEEHGHVGVFDDDDDG